MGAILLRKSYRRHHVMYRRFCLCKDYIRSSFHMSQKSRISFEMINIPENKDHFRHFGK